MAADGTRVLMGSGDERQRGRQRTRAVVAATIGTGIEFYDISVFGILAGLYINKVFFPQFDVVAGTLAAFFTFGLGFVVRRSRPSAAVKAWRSSAGG